MRARFLIAVLLGAVGALVWWRERQVASALEDELSGLRAQEREVAVLKQDSARLRSELPSADEWRRLQERAAEAEALGRELQQAAKGAPAAPQPLQVGGWRAAAEWQQRGSATPLATVETTLAAAAAGDLAALQAMLVLSPEVREQARAVFERLPVAARAAFATPDEMFAALTVKRIPVGDAQVVWQAEHSAEEASVGLLLRNPAGTVGATTFSRGRSEGAENRRPPQARDDAGTGMVFLSLKRADDGRWRIVVPLTAVASAAKELGLAPPR